MQAREAPRAGRTLPRRAPSARSLAAARRDDQLRRALNLAATQSSSHVVIVEPEAGEQLATIRAALARLLEREPRDLVWGVRNGAIVIARGPIPRTRRRSGYTPHSGVGL